MIAVGGTSGAAPLVAGMIALWTQKASKNGWPRPGFVAPLLYTLKSKGGFIDITNGDNIIFPNVECCTAAPGFDLVSGLGSPLANIIGGQLKQ
jgi:tripeptidyl-peptidase-1